MKIRGLATACAVATALALPTTAAARVTLVGMTSPASPGSDATLTVALSRSSTCSITVHYKSGPSRARGLYPKRGTRISWMWRVGTNTTPGRWGITVACGAAGTLNTSFVVR